MVVYDTFEGSGNLYWEKNRAYLYVYVDVEGGELGTVITDQPVGFMCGDSWDDEENGWVSCLG